MEWLQVVLLSLIQGLTEFLPISSSAHLVLPAQLTDWPDQGLAFDVAVHFGSLAAVLMYFRRDLWDMAGATRDLIIERRSSSNADLVIKLGVATLPLVVAGVLLRDFIEAELRTVPVIAFTTVFFALLLWLADRRTTKDTEVSWTTALTVGGAQVLALVPGTSRSGITITAALLVGLSRTSAARFSFLLAIPAIAGAQVLTTTDLASSGVDEPWSQLAAGMLMSGISAYLCIHYFIALVERTGMLPYVIYRLVLGGLLLLFIVG